jgi:hypothetical protein
MRRGRGCAHSSGRTGAALAGNEPDPSGLESDDGVGRRLLEHTLVFKLVPRAHDEADFARPSLGINVDRHLDGCNAIRPSTFTEEQRRRVVDARGCVEGPDAVVHVAEERPVL